MSILLGLDPGAAVGWCVLDIQRDVLSGSVAYWVAGGSCDAMFADVELAHWLRRVDLVALEEVQGYAYAAARTRHLIEAAKIGERLATVAREKYGRRVVQLPAARARLAVVGKNNPNDATIKTAVQRLVRNVPTRTNAHARDAAIVALAVGLMPPRRRTA